MWLRRRKCEKICKMWSFLGLMVTSHLYRWARCIDFHKSQHKTRKSIRPLYWSKISPEQEQLMQRWYQKGYLRHPLLTKSSQMPVPPRNTHFNYYYLLHPLLFYCLNFCLALKSHDMTKQKATIDRFSIKLYFDKKKKKSNITLL